MQKQRRKWEGRTGLAAIFSLVLALGACGGGGTDPDPAIAPFVGTWDAAVFTMTSDADPSIVVNVLTFGAFWIRIEPSGQYTATLEVPGGRGEVGQLSIVGSTIRLDPSSPATARPATANYSFTSADYLILDGPSEFDFNLDDVLDPAQAHIELRRR